MRLRASPAAGVYKEKVRAKKKLIAIAFFDCLHDMGDPVGAASHALKSLKPDGVVMIVEPFANDKMEDNLNPVGARSIFGHHMKALYSFRWAIL